MFGKSIQLSDNVSQNSMYEIEIHSPNNIDFDVALFGLDGNAKLSNEDYMIFYNQPISPCQSIQLNNTHQNISFNVNLSTLSPLIQHLFLTLTVNNQQELPLADLTIQLLHDKQLLSSFSPDTALILNGKSIFASRFDRTDAGWNYTPLNQVFDGDLASLVIHFGGEIESSETAEPTAKSPPQNLHVEVLQQPSQEQEFMSNDNLIEDNVKLKNNEATDFINYINSLHNLNASGVNALAESQSNSPYFQHVYTPFPVIETIQKLLVGQSNNIIVLTGHAGDGKSTIAFNILQSLDSAYEKRVIQEYEHLESHNLHVLKDMSELSLDARTHYLSEAFGRKGNWIIVSNTGPLLTSITDYLEKTNLQGKDNLSKILEILSQDLDILDDAAELERLKLDVDGKNLYIINIAKLDNIEIALQIFQKIIENKAWDLINQNYPTHPITLNRQTIYNHFDEVIDSIRLTYLYLINYERRLTLRQMLAHLASSITMGYTLTDDIEHTILFSDAFFGRVEADIWYKAKNLKLIELLSRLNLGGYTSLEVENIITSHDAFNDIDEPLKSIIQGYIQRDNDSYSSKIKSSLRRILFMYGLNDKSKDAKAHFLGSPSIRKFSNWRLDQESFSDYARSIKKACLTALNLFYSSSQDAKNLNITLKRSDSSVFQIAQLRICSVPESSFSVDYDTVKNLPFFYVKSNKKIRLDLSLPLLDYIDNILANDISDSLNPIYKTQLEKLKLNQIELKAA